MEHVPVKELPGLSHRWELWEGNEVGCLGKSVDHGQDILMTPGGREASEEVHCDVRPMALRDLQGLEESCRRLVG